MKFNSIYDNNFKRVFAYIFAKTGNRAVAEDICASSWQKAFTNFKQYNSEKGVPEQWIFGIVNNEIKKHYRLKHIKSVISLEFLEYIFTDPRRPDTDYEENSEKQLLFTVLNKLSDNEKEVITLKYYARLNNREIAKLTGLSESNVGTIAMRARQKAKQFLGEGYE